MQILIVGAGISGLSMALALEKAGFTARIIEKYPNLRSEGAAIALPMNAVQMLFYLGLKENLMNLAHTIGSITYAIPNGEVLSTSSLLDHGLQNYPFVALRREDLIQLLAHAITTKIEFSKQIIKVETDDTEQKIIKIEFNDGEIEKFDLVIGADGISSKLRSSMTHADIKEDLGISTWRFIANFKETDPIYFFGKKSAFMIYPISKDKVYCYAHIADKSKINLSNKTHLSHIFSEYCAKVNWIIQSVRQEDIIFGRLESISKPIFKSGHIALIGDASHACSPMLQQGAAQSLEDAITLSLMLKKFNCIDEALDHYENIRRPRVEWVIENSDTPIKSISSYITDQDYEKRNKMIRENGPLNIQKWKILFANDYFDIVDNYLF